jgi:hypothetical protein
MQSEDTSSKNLEEVINRLLDYGNTYNRVTEKDVKNILLPVALSSEQIKEQDLSTLEESSKNVDKMLEILRNEEAREGATQSGRMTLAFLYGKRSLILSGITSAKEKEYIKEIVSETKAESSPKILEHQIEELLKIAKEGQQKITQDQQQSKEIQDEIARSREKREAFKEKWTIWKSFIEKESISTIIGALLLLVTAICLIIASFQKIITFQIVEDGFLVLLGYFFGQTAQKLRER